MPEASCHIELSLITANPEFAGAAERAGVDRIFIDLETLGKQERQAGKGLFLSSHTPEDIARLSGVVSQKRLMVRLNALHPGTHAEIEFALQYGVGTLMLPMFETAAQVREFIALVAGRARVSLLLENRLALENIESVLLEPGIDEIHIGLNDLALSLGLKNWFDLFRTPILDSLSAQVTGKDLRFGLGGVTSPDVTHLPIPPERVIGEQVRLSSSMALLGRSFRGMFEEHLSEAALKQSIHSIRQCIIRWQSASEAELNANHEALVASVNAFYGEYPAPSATSPGV